MKTALKLGICMLFVSFFNLGVVKADTLPFELKGPPSDLGLILDDSPILSKELSPDGNKISYDLFDDEYSINLNSYEAEYIIFYDVGSKKYKVSEKESENTENYNIISFSNLKEAKEKILKDVNYIFKLPKGNNIYLLLLDKKGNIKYTLHRNDIVKHITSSVEYYEKAIKDRNKEIQKLNRSKVNITQTGTELFKVDYVIDFNEPGIFYDTKYPDELITFLIKPKSKNTNYVSDIKFDENATVTNGSAILSTPFIKDDSYILTMLRAGGIIAEANFIVNNTKEELDPDVEPNVTIEGIPKKRIPLGTEHKITIKTDIPCKIGVDHETTDEYITEYTFIVRENEKDKYYMAVAENGRSKEGYLDIDFFDTTKVAEETKAEDKPLVVPSENKLAQTGKERNWYFILIPFLAIIIVIGGIKCLKK